jgi:hypothetical protein
VDITNPELRAELLARFDRDQSARRASYDDGRFANEDANVALTEVDRENTARMKTIIAEHGWPGWKLVGVDGAHAAWILVQHADHDVPFQKDCLARLECAVKAGDADPADWAYLVDRVAVAEKRKQVYGTQFDEQRQPRPIEDEAHVDERRRSVVLGPMADYVRHMWETFGPPK